MSSTARASHFSAPARPVKVPAAAAIGNAIAAATGRRLRDLPLSRERVRAALAGNTRRT